MFKRILLGVSLLVLLIPGWSNPQSEIVVDDGVLRLAFDGTTLAAKRVESDLLTAYFDSPKSPIWAVTLLDTPIRPVSSSDLLYYQSTELSADRSYTLDETTEEVILTLSWTRIKLPEGDLSVMVKMLLPSGLPEAHWSITVQNTSTRYSLYGLDFPALSFLPDYSDGVLDTLIFPSHAGAIYYDPFNLARIRVTGEGDINPRTSSLVLPTNGLKL